jgi:hypothetical protein
MKRSTISVTDIIEVVLDREYYNISLFTYDYNTKLTKYDNKPFDVKLESIKFKIAFQYNFNWKEFRDAVYYFAKMNTPTPQETIDNLIQPIKEWLDKENKTQTTVLEIITEALGGKPIDLTQRQIEIRVGGCLNVLGWKKIKRNYGNIWIK